MTSQERIVRTPNPLVGVEFDLAVVDWRKYESGFQFLASMANTFGLAPLDLGIPAETKGRFKLVVGEESLRKMEGVTPHYFWLQAFAGQHYSDDGYKVALRRTCFTDGQQEYFPVLNSGGEGYLTEEQLSQETQLLWLTQVR